jgi:hypothetical protein
MITIVTIIACCLLSVLVQIAYISRDRKKVSGMMAWEEQVQTLSEDEDSHPYPYLLMEAMEVVKSKSNNRLN